MKHCRDDYTEREQHLTCVNCAYPLSDNWLVKQAYRQNTTVEWAKGNLKVLANMVEDRGMDWFASEVRRIMNGLQCLDI